MFGIKSENFDHWFADEFEIEPSGFKEFKSLTPSEFDQINDYLIEKYGAYDPLGDVIEDWAVQISFTIGDAKTKEILTYAAKQIYRFDKTLEGLMWDAPSSDGKTFDIAKHLRKKWQSVFLEQYSKRVKELGFDKKTKKRSKKNENL